MTVARAAAMSLAAVALRAQQPRQTAPRAAPGTIVGVVADTAGNAIDSAEVIVESLHRRTTADVNGSFRFSNIKQGTYEVSARRFGFAPQVRTVTVSANGATVKFALVPVPHGLAPVVSSAARGGLSGVVGDTAYNVVMNAEISVVASDRRAASDSLGRFFMDLRAGRYLIRVEHPGFHAVMTSVTIPNDGGRRMVVWLEPGSDAAEHHGAAAFEDLRQRFLRRTSMAKMYTREDLNHTSMMELTELVISGSGMRMDDACPAMIDGGPKTAPLWSIGAADIETLELYPPKSLGVYDPIIKPQLTIGLKCPVLVYVWLRK